MLRNILTAIVVIVLFYYIAWIGCAIDTVCSAVNNL